MKNNQYTATPNWFKDTTTSQSSQVGQQVTNYYIQGGSSSDGGTIDMSQVWEALAADTTEQINKSHLTDALKDIGLEGDFVDLTSDQSITGIKNFVNGLKISDKLINIVDGILYLDCNVAVTGGLTVYAQGTQDVPSIWDGAPFDNVTIHYNEETGLIEVIGGTGGGVSNWEDLQGKPTWITDTAPNNNIFPNTANYWVTDNNKISNWDNAVSKAHEHANKATLDKIYEKDGVIYWDGSLAVTGGITAYALGDVEVSTIMDGVAVDGTTIAKVDGVLKVLNAGGGEAGSVAWSNITDKPSWIGDTKPSYAWSEIGNKPTTLGGYGITDAYSKTDSDNRFVNVSGDTMTGNLNIQRIIIGSDNEINSTDKLFLAYQNTPQGVNICYNNAPLTYGSNNYTIWHAGNDGVGSGLDADLLDGLHKSSFFREYQLSKQNLDANNLDTSYVQYAPIGDMNTWDGTSFTNFPKSKPAGGFSLLVLREGNYKKQIYSDYNDNHLYVRTQYYSQSVKWNNWSTVALTTDNVASATKLQTARTIWGQSFDGTANVSGSLSNVSFIEMYYSTPFIDFHYNNSSADYTSRIIETSSGLLQFTHNVAVNGNLGIGTTASTYKLDVDGDIHANYGWLRTSGKYGWYSQTYGGGWYMTDGTYIRTYGGKKVYSSNGYLVPYSGSMWITMATRANIIDGDQNQSTDSAHALYRVKSSSGHAVCFGGLGDTVGFYGFYKSRIDANSNGTDWSTTWNTTNGTLTHVGNFLATGGITCYASDQRAKTVIEQINLSLKQIANAPTIRFKWNDWKIKDDGKTHIGGIAQYMQKLLPETVLESDDMLNMDYATTGYIFAVQTAKHLVKTDTEVERLKKVEKEVYLPQNGVIDGDIIIKGNVLIIGNLMVEGSLTINKED